jgi:hypothetical protein
MTRILIAALFGAVAMFVWTSIAHMVLPLGEAGIREIPNESAVLAAMAENIGQQSGLYLFPGFGLGPNATSEQKSEAMKHVDENLARHPSGIMVYHPAGSRPLTMGRYLLIEFLTEFFEVLIALLLLSKTRLATFGGRVGFVFAAGILAAIATNISYWNWYGFPALYTAGYVVTQLVGFFVAGLVAALVLKRQTFAS